MPWILPDVVWCLAPASLVAKGLTALYASERVVERCGDLQSLYHWLADASCGWFARSCNIRAAGAIVEDETRRKEVNSIRSQLHLSEGEERSAKVETQAGVFDHFAPALFAYLCQHTVSREDAEDLLHEIFLAALIWEPFYQLPASAREKWLWRVTRNKVADTHRRSVRRPSLTLDSVVDQLYSDEAQSPEDLLIRREEYARLCAALAQLPPFQQEALRLRFAHELSWAEVARVLGKREGALRSMLSRSLSRLRIIYAGKKEV